MKLANAVCCDLGRAVLALGSILICATAAPAQTPAPPQLGWRLDGDAFLQLGQGITTVHTPWARPAPDGPIRALFLANKSAAFDVPELAQRLDLQVTGMPAETWLRLGEWYWLAMWLESSTNSERLAHFETLLQGDFDVIVLANFRFESLSEAVQYHILRKVSQGCGLVLFYRHDLDPRLLREPLTEIPEALGRGTPFAALDFYRNWFMPSLDLLRPAQIPSRLLSACRFGAGRVLIVGYNRQPSVFGADPGAIAPPIEYDETAPARYDYYQSMAARCVQWAAGRDPRFVWTEPLPDGMEVPALASAARATVRAAWTGPDSTQLTRRTRVRNLWGEVLHEDARAITVDAGPLEWDTALPSLPGGYHFVDFQILRAQDGKQVVENWGSFTVKARPTIRIDAIQPASTFVESGEPVAARLVLSRPTSAGESASFEVLLADCYGRVFSQLARPLEPGADRVSFNMPAGNVVSWGARLRVRLLLGGSVVDLDEVALRLRPPSRGEYPIAMWGAVGGYGNHLGNLQMRNLGFNIILADDPLPAARDDIGWMTFGGGRGAVLHSLGDEIPVPRPGKGEILNRFLQSRYPSLEALNAAWGTRFATWEEVTPLYKAKDGDTGSFVRMHDCLSAGEFQFAEGIRTRREAIEKSNPTGLVGPEGSPVGDPELTLAQATFWGPYLTDRDNLLVNALARPGVLRGNWFGGYVEDRQVATRNRHRLWMSILGGNNMIEYFIVDGGLLAPDLTLMPFVHEFLPSWEQIRSGVGPQLATCRPTGNPVALLHSQVSQHVGQAGGPSTDAIKAHEYVLGVLGDAGYCPQYVATGQVKAGRLRQGDVRVLLLIQAFALADAEIAEIRAFAESGGTVIADIRPAWFDERCRLRSTGGLDAFLGFTAAAPVAELRPQVQRMTHVSSVNTPFGTMRLRGCGNPAGDHALVQRTHGTGRSVFLDGVVWAEGRGDPATVSAWRRLIEEVSGASTPFELSYHRPLDKLGTRVYSYQRGDIHIDAVLPPEATDPSIPVQPVLRWPEARQTYDLRTRTDLGRVDQHAFEIERSSPVVLARLDYAVGHVTIQAAAHAKVGEVFPLTCSLQDSAGKPRAGHVLRVAVFGPDGQERPYYGGILNGEGDSQSWRVPFALNDPGGKWRITVTDVISGVSSSKEFELDA